MSASGESAKQDADAVDQGLARHGHVSYLEIPAANASESASFYRAVFGWRIEPRDADHVSFDDLSGDLIGRFVTGRSVSRAPGLMAYIYVDRVDNIARAIAASGGHIVKPPYVEGNLLVATFRDPAGNLLGIWQAAST